MIRLIPYRQGFQYDEYYKVHEKDLPTKFFQEERDSFIIEDHQDPVGIASHFMMKSVAYLSIWMDPDKKLAEKKKSTCIYHREDHQKKSSFPHYRKRQCSLYDSCL